MPDLSDNRTPAAGGFQPYPPLPPASQPIPPPPGKQGSGALKIILIVVGIVVVLGIIGIGIVGYGVYRVAKTVHTDNNGHFTMNTPLGAVHTVSSATFTESELGIPIYPGAEPSKDGVRMNVEGKTVITAIFLTPDSVDQVAAFYKDKAGSGSRSIAVLHGLNIHKSEGADTSLDIKIGESPGAGSGHTRIVIQHVYKSAASN